jgi:hypothetical protein
MLKQALESNKSKQELINKNFSKNGHYQNYEKENNDSMILEISKLKEKNEWKNAKMNGFGISIWKYGKYIGNYKDDKKCGFGVNIDNYKNKYEGFWENGQHHSLGRYIKNDGTIKVGYSEGNKLKKIITNEKELLAKVEELNNNMEENNKKTLYIY